MSGASWVGASSPGPFLGETKMRPGVAPGRFVFTLMAGGRRSGRERKVLACPGPWGAADARVRALGSQPMEPGIATKAVPAVRALRNLRRVIPAPNLPLLDCLPKFALSSLASTEGE